MLMEVLNHSLDLWVDVPPQLLCPCVYMGKPSDRPEIPAIVVDNLQVALPVLLHDPLVEELLELVVPSLEVLLPVELRSGRCNSGYRCNSGCRCNSGYRCGRCDWFAGARYDLGCCLPRGHRANGEEITNCKLDAGIPMNA